MLVAFAILALVLVPVLQLFGDGLGTAATARAHTAATLFARSKLAATARAEPLREGEESGEAENGALRWRTSVVREDAADETLTEVEGSGSGGERKRRRSTTGGAQTSLAFGDTSRRSGGAFGTGSRSGGSSGFGSASRSGFGSGSRSGFDGGGSSGGSSAFGSAGSERSVSRSGSSVFGGDRRGSGSGGSDRRGGFGDRTGGFGDSRGTATTGGDRGGGSGSQTGGRGVGTGAATATDPADDVDPDDGGLEAGEGIEFVPYRIAVTVEWGRGRRSGTVTLATIRLTTPNAATESAFQ